MNNSICTLFDNILIDIHKFKSLHYLLLLKLYQKGWNGNPTFVLCNFKADSYEKFFKTNFRNNDVFICCLCEW